MDRKQGIEPNIDVGRYKISNEDMGSSSSNKSTTLSSEEAIKKSTNYANFLDRKNDKLQTFTNEAYRREALAVAPMWLWKDAKKNQADINHFKWLTTFEVLEDHSTLMIKIFNNDARLIALRRRRKANSKAKWSPLSGTSSNNTTIKRFVDNTSPIFVCEGHHDALTSVLMGINFIAVPNVGYTEFSSFELSLLRDKEVIFIPDIDTSDSVSSMTKLLNQCDGIAQSLSMIDLREVYRAENIAFPSNDKFDLSTLTEVWSKGLSSLKSVLSYHSESEGIF